MKKSRSLLAFMLAFVMILSTAIPSYAADVGDWESSLEERYEAKAAEVVRGFGFDENTSDYDKVVAIQTWIYKNVKYDYYYYYDGKKGEPLTSYPSNKYGPMFDGAAICGGYADVFNDLSKRSGVESYAIYGRTGTTGHVWNIVNINGEYYYIDPTNLHSDMLSSNYFLFGENSTIGTYCLDEEQKTDKYKEVKEYNYRYYHSKCSSHNFVKGPNSESPTCTTDGYDIYYCSNDAEGNETGSYGCNAYYKVKIPMLGHDLGEPEVTKEATCTEDGVITRVCKTCKKKITETIPKLAHDFDYDNPVSDTRVCYWKKNSAFSGTIVFKCKNCDATEKHSGRTEGWQKPHDYTVISDTATCTEDGVITKMCLNERTTDNRGVEYNGKKVCGDKITESSPATGHRNTELRNATDTYTGDTYCLDCGALVAKGHSVTHHWDDGEVTKAPTCTEAGEKTYHCTDDGCSGEKKEEIPATGHVNTEVRNIKQATCTERGYTGDTYCKDCGAKLSGGYVVWALDHSYEKTEEKEATCKEAGYVKYICERCGSVKMEELPKTDEHTWDDGKVTKAATCTEDGVKTYTCTVCGVERTEAVKATGHDWDAGTVTKAATCTEAGVLTKHCKNDGCTETKTETIPATGHSWDDGVVTKAAACEETGVLTKHCKNSGCTETKTETIPATGHQHTEVRDAKKATCTEQGYTGDTYCLDCGKMVEPGSTTAPAGHAWDNGVVTTVATCTAEGVKTYTCKSCGETKTEAIAKTDHQHMEVRNVVSATCTGRGYTGDTYCKDCGAKVASGQYTDAKGHSYGTAYTVTNPTAVSEGVQAHKCTRCGQVETWKVAKITATGNLSATNFPLKVKKAYTLKVENMAAGDRVVSWKSSNTKVATVNGSGKVTATKKTGKTTITAILASGKTLSTTVKVQKGNVKTSKVTVSSARNITLKMKQNAQIKAARFPVTSSQGLTYSTSNKKIATVSKNGKITAQKKTGKATLTVKSGSKKVKITVKVVK